jgi:hypothetical protein
MTLDDRLAAFEQLGNFLRAIDAEALSEIYEKVRNENPWFTQDSITFALQGVAHYLEPEKLRKWVSAYNLNPTRPANIALVMAGNIPLAGFHDLLTILLSGHGVMVKLSSKDSVLPSFICDKIIEADSRFEPLINIAPRLKNFDAVIATGSDNSARYFQYYFGKYPHIIRKNRTSCAVLTGTETEDDLQMLGRDVFTYFGLGCRNVSKIFLPENFDPVRLIKAWNIYAGVLDHHKYHNNYDYQKSILLVNKIPFYDSGFFILHENEKLVSPISVVYYEYYSNAEDLSENLRMISDKVQCVVGNTQPGAVPFGKAQLPEVWDYADKMDTLKFLETLA